MGPIVPSLLQLWSLFRINFTHQYTTCFPKTDEEKPRPEKIKPVKNKHFKWHP
jgi:hypothetical protein